MTTDTGTSIRRSPAAHRVVNSPTSSPRQRDDEHPCYVPLPGEEAAGVRHGEDYLVGFCAAGIEAMPWEHRPTAAKYAVNYLVVLALADEVRAELFLEPIAAAAGVTTTALRKQVEDRCWFYRNFHRLHTNRNTRQQVIDELVRMIAA